ncbi:uncharacterized protein LOC133035608 [Cannabis sativa]|uniref:uncharacterized protein LOC133035608 n=1 Tax=Cannabis sativa TaxID=3483 RepID=UPI0029CA133A|nr:uncharacterized protein LOC133035608 [Cannabis sativa]
MGWLPRLKIHVNQLPTTIAIVASYDTFGASLNCRFCNYNYYTYQELSSALEKMFSCFMIGSLSQIPKDESLKITLKVLKCEVLSVSPIKLWITTRTLNLQLWITKHVQL